MKSVIKCSIEMSSWSKKEITLKDGCSSLVNGKNSTKQPERRMNTKDCVFLLINACTGSSIFITPKEVLKHAGSAPVAMIIWLISGILCHIGALCYSDLAELLPISGGDYAYITWCFGDLAGFLFIWATFFVIGPAIMATMALTIANHMLQPFWQDCPLPDGAVKLCAAMVLIIITMTNCCDWKVFSKVLKLLFIAKVISFSVIMGLMFLPSICQLIFW